MQKRNRLRGIEFKYNNIEFRSVVDNLDSTTNFPAAAPLPVIVLQRECMTTTFPAFPPDLTFIYMAFRRRNKQLFTHLLHTLSPRIGFPLSMSL